MLRFLVPTLCLFLAMPVEAWDWDLHYRIAVAAGVPSSAAHGVTFPDMMRPHDPKEGSRHYMNAEYFPPGLALGSLPITYAAYASQETQPEKTGSLLYEILYYAGAYRHDRGSLRNGDFNENLLRLAHLSADLYQPLHLTNNYDGQLTGQRGAHERVENYADSRVTRVTPAPFAPIRSDADLWRVIQSEAVRNRALAPQLLAADAAASKCGRPYADCFTARKLIQGQANRAAGFLAALRAYLEAAPGEATRYLHRE